MDLNSFGIRALARETILGFVFWSLFSALPAMIWFYPLNAMEVSGYEVFLLVLFSPILLGCQWIRTLVHTRKGQVVIRTIVVASLASFQAPSTLSRLTFLAFGNFAVMMSLTSALWNPCRVQRVHTFWGLILGMFMFLVSRIWYTTYVPTWNDVTSNNIVISLASIATLDKIVSGGFVDDRASESPVHKSDGSNGPWFRVGLGFGGLLFLNTFLFGEVSLVVRWGGQSYPNTGPLPYPWGFLVLCALAIGLALSQIIHKIRRLAWCFVGLGSFLTLYYHNTYISLSGGLVLAVFTMSLWPVMTDKLQSCPPGRTMAVAVLTWCLEILYAIWTVAYNFVPGGVYTREHTDHLIFAVMISIGIGYLSGRPNQHVFNLSHTHVSQSLKAILLMVLIGAVGFLSRLPKQSRNHPPKVHPKADFSAGVWAFHFGYDNEGWPSMDRSSEFITDTGVDIIGLLETDASRPYLGNHDLVTWLSERLGMYGDFGPPTRDHTWGVALLSKYPITKSSHHLLPSPHGELAPAILATVNMTGSMVDILVTHMGNEWDALDRELQAKELATLLKNTDNPVVFLGYVTSKPGSKNYDYLMKEGNVLDIDYTDMKRFCEYIFYRGLVRLGYARISHGGLSDTEMHIGKFRIPQDPERLQIPGQVITDPNMVEEDIHFNPKFGDYKVGHSWAKEHKFHMSTPKYFLL